MTEHRLQSELPAPDLFLAHGDVVLSYSHTIPGRPEEGMVPYYHFRITIGAGEDVGHINFRVGDTEHVRLYAGHLGFAVAEHARGKGLARQACLAIAPLVKRFYETVLLTCNPENAASRRTIERLGAHFLEEIEVSPDDVTYKNGARRKRRYQWTP